MATRAGMGMMECTPTPRRLASEFKLGPVKTCRTDCYDLNFYVSKEIAFNNKLLANQRPNPQGTRELCKSLKTPKLLPLPSVVVSPLYDISEKQYLFP